MYDFNKSLLLSLIVICNIFAQYDAKIEYSYHNLSLVKNISKQETKSEELNNRINKTIEQLNFELIFKKNKSIFKVKESLGLNDKDRIYQQLSIMLPKTYINFKDMMLFDSFEISGQKILIKEGINKNWTITNEFKNISGYKCQKAILKDNETDKNTAEAWFTKEITLPIGPSYYAGLPGLIIKLLVLDNNEKPSIQFNVEDIDLSPQKEIKLPKQKTISMDEFNEILNGTRSRF